jgi:hypothetical protein
MPRWLMRHRRAIAVVLGVLSLGAAVLAFVWAGSQQTTILHQISCPVYQPPATPNPAWPQACGGQQPDLAATGTNAAAFIPALFFLVIGLACFRYALVERVAVECGCVHPRLRRKLPD